MSATHHMNMRRAQVGSGEFILPKIPILAEFLVALLRKKSKENSTVNLNATALPWSTSSDTYNYVQYATLQHISSHAACSREVHSLTEATSGSKSASNTQGSKIDR